MPYSKGIYYDYVMMFQIYGDGYSIDESSNKTWFDREQMEITMEKIIVTLQSKMNPVERMTNKDGDRIQCPVCNLWITIKYFNFQGIEIPKVPQVCENCKSKFSIAR